MMIRYVRRVAVIVMCCGFLLTGIGCIAPHYRATITFAGDSIPVPGIFTVIEYLAAVPKLHRHLEPPRPELRGAGSIRLRQQYFYNQLLSGTAIIAVVFTPIVMWMRRWFSIFAAKVFFVLLLGIWHSAYVGAIIEHKPMWGYYVFSLGFTLIYASILLMPPRPPKPGGFPVLVDGASTEVGGR